MHKRQAPPFNVGDKITPAKLLVLSIPIFDPKDHREINPETITKPGPYIVESIWFDSQIGPEGEYLINLQRVNRAWAANAFKYYNEQTELINA